MSFQPDPRLPTPDRVLPHGPGSLFLDGCLRCEEDGITCTGVFAAQPGHFPDDPIVRGVDLLEGMAQALAYWALHRGLGARVLLAGIDKARFRHPVRPGQTVRWELEIERVLSPGVIARGVARVDDLEVASARITGALVAKPPSDG